MKVWLPTAWKGTIYEACPIDANWTLLVHELELGLLQLLYEGGAAQGPHAQLSRCCLRASHTPSTTWAARLGLSCGPASRRTTSRSCGCSGADHPKPRMLPRSEELYEPIPEREYRESLYDSPFPHGALLLPFSCCIRSWLILQLRLLRYSANYFVTEFYEVRIAGPILLSCRLRSATLG